jgi:thymidylate kinase
MHQNVSASDPPLHLAIELFDRLNRSGIRYCHWKSNIRLGKSLAGKTDFDILVERKGLDRFIGIAKELDFRPMISRPERHYEGLSDFLGMDAASGGLLHIHLHDRLVLGSRAGKDIELPIEPLFWSNLERAGNVSVPALDLELIVLLLRAMLKSTPRRGSKSSRWMPADIVEEVTALYRRCDTGRFATLLGQTGLDLSAERMLHFAAALASNRLERGELTDLRAEVLSALAPCRPRWSALDWFRRGQRAFFETRWAKINLLDRRKRLQKTGICIVLVGADGSGKTTHTCDLRRWLSWKVVCSQAYFGLPKSSRIYRILGRIERKFERLARTAGLPRKFPEKLAGIARSAKWLWSARSRVGSARRVEQLLRRGAIVVCDRYPLAELVRGDFSMDGPRIRQESGGRFSSAARLEERWYRNIRRPDLIVVLRTAAEELQRRKPNADTQTIERKARLILEIGEGPNIVLVDNNRSFPEVQLDIRRLTWDRLRRKSG